MATYQPGEMAAKRLFAAYAKALQQLEQAQADLNYALETIQVLEAELETTKTHGNDVVERLKKSCSIRVVDTTIHDVAVREIPSQIWVDDIWLCKLKDFAILHEAEQHWLEKMPQQALNKLTGLKKQPSLSTIHRMECAVLESAVLFSNGQYEKCRVRADEVLRIQEQHPAQRHLPVHRHVVGIAQYLRGRACLELGDNRDAYWSFSLAVTTKDYHEKVVDFKDTAHSRLRNSNP